MIWISNPDYELQDSRKCNITVFTPIVILHIHVSHHLFWNQILISVFFLFQIFTFCSLQGLLGRFPEEEREKFCPPKTLVCKAKHNECKGTNQGWPRHQLLRIVIVGYCTIGPTNAHIEYSPLSDVFRCAHLFVGALVIS